jgi:hypothetical protein
MGERALAAAEVMVAEVTAAEVPPVSTFGSAVSANCRLSFDARSRRDP